MRSFNNNIWNVLSPLSSVTIIKLTVSNVFRSSQGSSSICLIHATADDPQPPIRIPSTKGRQTGRAKVEVINQWWCLINIDGKWRHDVFFSCQCCLWIVRFPIKYVELERSDWGVAITDLLYFVSCATTLTVDTASSGTHWSFPSCHVESISFFPWFMIDRKHNP